MRYFYERPLIYTETKGSTYTCDHPVYNDCTLYLKDGRGLAVIQQHYDPITKSTSWGKLDPWLVDDIYLQPTFDGVFDLIAGKPKAGLYPTVTVRQIMWTLRMKPLRKEPWETIFERKFI